VKLLVVDNFDSFTFNLVHMLEGILMQDVDVLRNDVVTPSQAERFDHIVFSPGPGLPPEAGNMNAVIKSCGPGTAVLGVCLGMQAIAEVYGGTLKNLSQVHHGVAIKTRVHNAAGLFQNFPEHFLAGRYHSWVVDEESLPACFSIDASDSQNEIMAISHVSQKMCGVQFHPESILTQHGRLLLENWLSQ
jgi:anthranilate synthase component 2